MFLSNVAQFKREGNGLSEDVRSIAKKRRYNKDSPKERFHAKFSVTLLNTRHLVAVKDPSPPPAAASPPCLAFNASEETVIAPRLKLWL